MEKLELKHLAGYLPYGLKWTLQEMKTFEMQGITPNTLYTKEGAVLNWEKHPDLPQALFPILRPLSDLTKEIEVNGDLFVPMMELVKIMHPNEELFFLETSRARNVQSVRYKYHSGRNTVCDTINIYTEELNQGSKYCFNILNTDWWIIQKLLEWHFDIYGLIEKGLAIDINKI